MLNPAPVAPRHHRRRILAARTRDLCAVQSFAYALDLPLWGHTGGGGLPGEKDGRKDLRHRRLELVLVLL